MKVGNIYRWSRIGERGKGFKMYISKGRGCNLGYETAPGLLFLPNPAPPTTPSELHTSSSFNVSRWGLLWYDVGVVVRLMGLKGLFVEYEPQEAAKGPGDSEDDKR
jgi:hypothetical protein